MPNKLLETISSRWYYYTNNIQSSSKFSIIYIIFKEIMLLIQLKLHNNIV